MAENDVKNPDTFASPLLPADMLGEEDDRPVPGIARRVLVEAFVTHMVLQRVHRARIAVEFVRFASRFNSASIRSTSSGEGLGSSPA